MEKKHFGFGIVGTGMISNFHAKAIAEIKNASLIGVYGPTSPLTLTTCSSRSSISGMVMVFDSGPIWRDTSRFSSNALSSWETYNSPDNGLSPSIRACPLHEPDSNAWKILFFLCGSK